MLPSTPPPNGPVDLTAMKREMVKMLQIMKTAADKAGLDFRAICEEAMAGDVVGPSGPPPMPPGM